MKIAPKLTLTSLRLLLVLLLLAAALLLAGTAAQAALVTWTNAATAVWTNATAWNPNGLLSATTDYDVPPGAFTVQAVDANTSTFTGNSLSVRTGDTIYFYRVNGGTALTVNDYFTNTTALTASTLTVSNAFIKTDSSLGTVTHRIKTPCVFYGTNTITFGNTCAYTLDMYLDSTLSGSGSVNLVRSSAGTSGNPRQRDLFLTGNCSGYSGNWTNTGVAASYGLMTFYVSNPSGWGSGNMTMNAYSTLNVNAGLTNPSPRVTLNSSSAVLNVNNASTIGSLSGAAGSTANLNNSLTLADNNNSTFAGTVTGAGPLTKNGSGTLTIASISLSGVLTNKAGALIAAGSVGGLVVGAGSTLSPGSAALTAGSLTLGGDLVLNTNTLNFDVSNTSGSGNDSIAVSGNLTLNGTNKINLNLLNGATDNTGPYTIMTYGGTLTGGATNFQIIGSHAATLDLSVPGQVNLWFTNGTPMNLVWAGDGGNNYWDAGSSFTWLNGITPDYFGQGDNVTFNDSSANLTVNVSGTVSPGGFNVAGVNNNYVIQGSGVIGGGAALLKTGAASLTISNANAFTGGTTLSAGSVYAANTNAPLGTGPVTLGDAGTGTNTTALYLAYKATLTNAIVVSANGTGAAILGGDQVGGASGNSTTFSGPITLNRSLTLDSGAQLDRLHFGGVISGTGDLTLLGGHRIDIGGNNTFSGNLYIQGAGTLFETFGASCIPTTATVDVGSGTTFGLFYSATISALTGAGLTEPYGGTCTLTVGANNGSGTYNGTLTNNGSYVLSLVKTGAGTQTLNGPDYRTANTTVSGGTLAIGVSGSISNSATITVASGATFDVSAKEGFFALNPGQTLAGAGNVSGGFNVSSNATLSAGGSGTPATLTFNHNLTLAGNAILAFDLTNTTTAGSGVNDLISVGGNLTLAGSNVISLPVLSQQALVPGTYQLMTYSGTLTGGAANLTVSPVLTRFNMAVDTSTAGQVNLVVSGSTSNLVWSGGLNGNAWDVATTANWDSSVNVFYNQDGASFTDAGGANPNVSLATTMYPSSVNVNSSSNYVFGGSGKIAGATGLVKGGSGTLTISNANTYTGNTTLNGGTLQLNAAAAAGTGTINVGANTLGVNIGAATLANTITGSGTINVAETNGANTLFGGDMSGFTGNLYLPASPGGTAKTAITSASVNLNSAATINIASGGTFYTTMPVTSTIKVAGMGNSENLGALRLDGSITVSGPVQLQGNASIGNNSSGANISGVISDGGNGYGFTKMGGYTLTLSGNNTYTGTTIVTNGTVNVTGDESAATGGWSLPVNYAGVTVNFQSGSTVVVASNKFVQVGSSPSAGTPNNQTLNANGNVTNNGSLLVARGGYLNINSGATWVQNGAASNCPPTGSGYGSYIQVAAGGTLIYNGTNTFKIEPSISNTGVGSFTNAGTVITAQGFERTINTSAANPLLVANGGVFILATNVSAFACSPLVTTGGVLTVQMAAGGGTFDTAGYSTAISNAVSGSGSLTKIGAGTLSLPFTNTYTGATYLNGGTLLVGGKLAPGSAVTVSANTTLAGTGIIGGATTINGGGTIQPGAGTFTISNLTLGATPADFCTNAFTVGAGAKIFTTTLNVYGTNIVRILDAALTVGTNDLVYYSGGIGGNGFGGFVLGALPAGVTGHLQDSGTAVQLVVTSVPTLVPPTLGGGVSLGSGGFQLTFSGPAGETYKVLSATNVATPLANWSVLSTGTFGASPVIYVDTTASSRPKTFYRIAAP